MNHRASIQDRAGFAGELGFLQHAAEQALSKLGAGEGDLTIAVVNKEQMRSLNRDYVGLNQPTDVLSFPHHEIDSESGRMYLGDIVICLELARSQAKQAGHSLQAELQLLAVHGVLHLLGHDHQEEQQAGRMLALQAEILNSLGGSSE